MADVIPELMGIFEALKWGKKGYHIRRAIWVEPVEEGMAVPGSTGKRVTAWVAYADGLWFYRPRGEADRVVRAADVDSDDFRAADWTTRDAEWNTAVAPPAMPQDTPTDGVPALPPLPVERPPGASDGEGSGDADGGGSGDADDGNVDEGSGGFGGSGGAGGGGGGGSGSGGRRRPKPDRDAPAVTVTVNRVSPQECVPLLDGGAVNAALISDDFTVNVALAADPDAHMGEVWFLTVFCKRIRHKGTIAPGDNVDVDFTLHDLPPNAKVPVVATVYLARVGLSGQGQGTAEMRDHCPDEDHVPGCTDPLAINFDPSATIDDGSCSYGIPPVYGCTDVAALNYDPEATINTGCIYGCPPGTHYDAEAGECVEDPPVVYGCTNPSAYNYNPAATVDDASCVLSCDVGWHWDEATQQCVEDEE